MPSSLGLLNNGIFHSVHLVGVLSTGILLLPSLLAHSGLVFGDASIADLCSPLFIPDLARFRLFTMWFPNPPHIYGGILCANPACEYMVSSNVRIRAYCCRQCHNCWLTHTYSAHKHDQNCEKTKPSDPWGVRAPPVPPMLSLPNPLLPSEDTVVKLDTQYENLIQYMQWVEGLEDEAQVDPPPVQDDPLAEQQDPPAQQQPASSSRPVIACLLCRRIRRGGGEREHSLFVFELSFVWSYCYWLVVGWLLWITSLVCGWGCCFLPGNP